VERPVPSVAAHGGRTRRRLGPSAPLLRVAGWAASAVDTRASLLREAGNADPNASSLAHALRPDAASGRAGLGDQRVRGRWHRTDRRWPAITIERLGERRASGTRGFDGPGRRVPCTADRPAIVPDHGRAVHPVLSVRSRPRGQYSGLPPVAPITSPLMYCESCRQEDVDRRELIRSRRSARRPRDYRCSPNPAASPPRASGTASASKQQRCSGTRLALRRSAATSDAELRMRRGAWSLGRLRAPSRCRRIVATTSRRGGSEPSISRAGHPRMAAAAPRA
jgi:hypothetical protein